METDTALRIPIDWLEEWCGSAFLKCGLRVEDARLMANTLVKAEASGMSSHGVVRLPSYCQRLIDKGSNPTPQMKLIVDMPSLILLDGDNGLGQIVSVRAMQLAIDRAKQNGICFVGARNSCHLGLAGYYPAMASAQGLIGIAGSNTRPVMAVWGGSRRALGNNPLAVAIPTGKGYPILLDMAMSVTSGGRVRLEALKGTETIPIDWILDSQGRRTTNPKDLGVTGVLLPLGHKGSGLAFVIEVLSSILTASMASSDMTCWFEDTATPIGFGHFFLAINIQSLIPLDAFINAIDRRIDELKSTPLMEGSPGVFMPGELEFNAEHASTKHGVPVSGEVIQRLNEFARKIGIEELAVGRTGTPVASPVSIGALEAMSHVARE
jgi:LDH2 family malate/lactate/ureidoglycolate dehydrogenase